jgi:hypothetical protein
MKNRTSLQAMCDELVSAMIIKILSERAHGHIAEPYLRELEIDDIVATKTNRPGTSVAFYATVVFNHYPTSSPDKASVSMCIDVVNKDAFDPRDLENVDEFNFNNLDYCADYIVSQLTDKLNSLWNLRDFDRQAIA